MKVPTILSVIAKVKYKIFVKFNDRTEGTYDLSQLAGKGVFKVWDEDEIFFQVYINPESGAITWPGELDIDIITVYCAIKNIAVDEYLKTKTDYAAY